MKKAFTTIELVVAVGLLAVVIVIAGSIFNITIKAKRQATAIAEITRNFRAITEQIDRDFKGLVKDGYLVVRCDTENVWKNETDKLTNDNSLKVDARRDNMLFFATGDYQSLANPGTKSNTALVYIGFEKDALDGTSDICSDWTLARAAALLLPTDTNSTMDSDLLKSFSLAGFKADAATETALSGWLSNVSHNMWQVDSNDTDSNWKYFAGNVGSFKIEWTDGTIDSNDMIDWQPDPNSVPVSSAWTPQTAADLPSAIKFTMTLYDSRGVIKEGKTLTYIVYIKE